jgi:hypothetical protein
MAEIRGGLFVRREQATGAINNSNTVFTTSRRYISGTLRVELNGQSLIKDNDYTETTHQSFTMFNAPLRDSNYSDTIVVEYQQQ